MELKDKTNALIAELCHFFSAQFTHILSVDDDLTCIRLVQCSHNLEQSRFACSAGTNNADYFSLVNV